MVLDAERVASRMSTPCDGPRAFLLSFYPDAEIPDERSRDPEASPLVARINHGAWIVSCPCDAEGEPAPGMMLWLSVPWAWCVRCRNASAGGKWRPVTVPPRDELAAIERVLAERHAPISRNWLPGETVAHLVAENTANGDPVPDGIEGV